jgi:hypothetical protein
MRDSNVANAAKESTQREFSHGLLDLCTLLGLLLTVPHFEEHLGNSGNP